MKTTFIWALFVGVAMFFTSCEQNDVDPALDVDELASFAMVSTSANISTDSATGRPCTPGSKGMRRRLTEVAVADLPVSISALITSRLPGATIVRAGKTNGGDFIVLVKAADDTKHVLTFNARGEFVSRATHQRFHGTKVELSDLPGAITSYITATYPRATLVKAGQGREGRYVVAIKRADDSVLGLAFDRAGVFITELALDGEFGCRKGGKPKKK
ncbi:hypothetical protein [Rufibacter sp. LB8]|uniref:hypothetical protein n=1 Tax=Rufibacter sp. LB8 TaxID=2777781 RepID=UPI00178C3412|nr:hypothetical protein [Rufibacter sp. LB8]